VWACRLGQLPYLPHDKSGVYFIHNDIMMTVVDLNRVVFVVVTSGGDNYSNFQCGGNKHPCLG